MTQSPPRSGVLRLSDELREQILAAPEALLADAELMRALVGAHERELGSNVVDLRGLAMRSLEGRLGQLESTHRTVIAAAYENLAGTNLIHRATLALLRAEDFPAFLKALEGDLPDVLRVDSLCVVIEAEGSPNPALQAWSHVVKIVPPGRLEGWIGGDASLERAVILRNCTPQSSAFHGRAEGELSCEALLRLDPSPGLRPAWLALGGTEQGQFGPHQATDLLRFFGSVFALTLRRWLA